ncbi:hypothetical protein RFN66_08585 [Bacillus paralicheniformis]|uniref:hypothetical protein n=1 Tax=Bacillus paralicheniformis TaxID=1648923 RepID=UPI000D03401E|nr:hypothetical protein [Bacillus paralicheniformis]WMW48978.1 hypothetical protein RFN66_08585 [Bacillus paralicheniformis]
MSGWKEERAELERQLINAKQTVIKYEGTLKPSRTVTESEYREAKRVVVDLASQISNGDYEAGRPSDPYEGMTAQELRSLYEEKKANYRGYAGSGREAAELMRIDTRIQALESREAE